MRTSHDANLRNQKDAPVSRFLAGEIRLVDFFRKNRCNSKKKKNPEPLKSRQNLPLAQNDKRLGFQLWPTFLREVSNFSSFLEM